jgi:NTE family protein
MATKTTLAIACQGGGSHTAFTAGVLKALFAAGVHQRYEIVGLSGTSGGAICATLAWQGLLWTSGQDRGALGRGLDAFWGDVAAWLPWERVLNDWALRILRLQDNGLVPSFASYPSSDAMVRGVWRALSPRRGFLDLRALLEEHIDFDGLARLVGPSSPVLMLGAVDVLSGKFKRFDSRRGEISADAVLASAAIPSLFPAVEIAGRHYWDGLFAENPPLFSLAYACRPDAIWIIRINPAHRRDVPITSGAIIDRTNELSGDIVLRNATAFLRLLNRWYRAGAFRPEFAERHRFKPVTIRTIGMDRRIADDLDHASKLDRDPALIARLMAEGRRQAADFLQQPDPDG